MASQANPKISNPRLLRQMLGQCDNDNELIRQTALEKIRVLLARDQLRLIDLVPEQTVTSPPLQPKQDPAPAAAANSGPYIHDPLVRKGLFMPRPKKRVVPDIKPPAGSVGRFRVLKHETRQGIHKLTCSLETEHEIFEPFLIYEASKTDSGLKRLDVFSDCSRTGRPLRF